MTTTRTEHTLPLPDERTTAAVADAIDAEREAAAANNEARSCAWAAVQTTADDGGPAAAERARHLFQETVAWGVCASAWADAAAVAARKSGHHPQATAAARGADEAKGYAMGHVRLASKAAHG